jgi:hypothetical protein
LALTARQWWAASRDDALPKEVLLPLAAWILTCNEVLVPLWLRGHDRPTEPHAANH